MGDRATRSLLGEGLRLRVQRDAALEAATDAHYTDAAYYERTYADRERDIDYYVALAADRAAKSRSYHVLEYGCGSGRITLPLARIGLEVTGVDRSKPMLTQLRAALRREPVLAKRVTVRSGDMRRMRLRRRFDLVLCTFNTWLHLYSRSDVELFCARVRDHLKRGGLFVFDVSVPDPRDLHCDPKRRYRAPRFRHPSAGVVRYAERFRYEPLSQVLTVTMEFEPLDGERWETPLAHRQFFPQELEALLHYNGLAIVDLHGDFGFEPPDSDTETLIYHCRTVRR